MNPFIGVADRMLEQSAIWMGIRRWYAGYPGRVLCERISEQLGDMVADLFGYQLLQVGQLYCAEWLLQECRIRFRTILATQVEKESQAEVICGDPAMLPIATDSIDAAILLHTLDSASDPLQVLREIERVLIPEGRVLILGFNPMNPFGLWRFGRLGAVPWGNRFIRQGRVVEWLRELDFDVELTRGCLSLPPLRQVSLMGRLPFLERAGRRWWPLFSSVYLVRAVKRVTRLTPIRTRWRRQAALVKAGVVEPSARGGSVD